MKLLKTLFTILVVGALAMVLIAMRPTKADFAEYYVEKHSTGLGELVDNVFEKIVMEQTEVNDFVVFSVFEVNETDRYIGVLGQFFGRSSVEEAGETVKDLIDQAKDAFDGE